jgi:hypothetical protein
VKRLRKAPHNSSRQADDAHLLGGRKLLGSICDVNPAEGRTAISDFAPCAPRFATLLARTGKGTTHTLRFSADGASVIHELRGDAATFELYLSALNRRGRQHACTSGPLSAGDRQSTKLTPPDWHDLSTVVLSQTGPATTRTLSATPIVAAED